MKKLTYLISLLMLVSLTAFAPPNSGKSPESDTLLGIDAQDRPADPSADLSLSGEAEESHAELLLHLTASNAGPDAAEELDLVVNNYDQLDFPGGGCSGWTCRGRLVARSAIAPAWRQARTRVVLVFGRRLPTLSPTLFLSVYPACHPDPTPNPNLHFWTVAPGANTIEYLPLVSAK
jgi:hypothetical protein